MVALKAGEAARALEKPDPRWRVWLVYGPDAGLVSERVDRIVSSALGDANDDPFRLVRLDGDDIASDPMRLTDEANTIGLFGGDRVIRVGRTGKMLASAVEPLLKAPPEGAIVVIEAGELTNKNPLRSACERSPNAVALPCYADEARGLAELVDSMLRAEGVTIDRAGREALLASLGSDRLVSRQEIGKLLLYVGAGKRVELADVEAVVGDSAMREVDALIDAVFSGQAAAADAAWVRLRQEGSDATVLAGAVQRHALMLLQARLRIDEGQSRQHVGESLRLPYPRKAAAQAALGLWTAHQLVRVVTSLATAIADARKTATLAPELIHRVLIALGQQVASGRSGGRRQP